jgi:hypothetical protein
MDDLNSDMIFCFNQNALGIALFLLGVVLDTTGKSSG